MNTVLIGGGGVGWGISGLKDIWLEPSSLFGLEIFMFHRSSSDTRTTTDGAIR